MKSRFNWSFLLICCLSGPSVFAQDSSSADPALDIIERLLAELRKKPHTPVEAVETTDQDPPAKSDPGFVNPIERDADESVDEIIDDVAKKAQVADLKRSKEAAEMLVQARAAMVAGRIAEAQKLATSARKLDPDNQDIVVFLDSLPKALNGTKGASTAEVKAKAYLAAGLTRGQLLIQRGRYADGADLLAGVVRACDLFSKDSGVSLYRRLALKELETFRAKVKAGEIDPGVATDKESEPVLVVTGAAPPENLRRILRTAESDVPPWYSKLKNRLAFRIAVDYEKVPAGVVFEDIAKQTGTRIVIDDPIQRSRAHLNTNIDLRVAEVPAETVLNLACAKSGLEYVLMENAVVITTPARAVRYLSDLPDSVRENWTTARVLFPEMTPELLASPPLPSSVPGQLTADTATLDRDVPAHSLSGDALVKSIKAILP